MKLTVAESNQVNLAVARLKVMRGEAGEFVRMNFSQYELLVRDCERDFRRALDEYAEAAAETKSQAMLTELLDRFFVPGHRDCIIKGLYQESPASKPNEPDWHTLGLRRPDEYQMTRAGAPGRLMAYVWLTPTEAVTVRPMELNDRVDWLKSKGCGLDASQPVKESQGF